MHFLAWRGTSSAPLKRNQVFEQSKTHSFQSTDKLKAAFLKVDNPIVGVSHEEHSCRGHSFSHGSSGQSTEVLKDAKT